MTEHADQIVLEYPSRATDAAHRSLGSRERTDFMTRLRRRIDEQRAAAGGATEPEQIRKVRAVGARTVRLTPARARGRPRGR